MNERAVYVLCPYGLVTGGPDALHQMVYYLNQSKIEAHLVYCDTKKRNLPIPEAYKRYVDSYSLMGDIPDSEDVCLVAPETITELLNQFRHTKKYVWWLSVQNDTNSTIWTKIKRGLRLVLAPKNWKKLLRFSTIKNTIRHKPYSFSESGVTHLCASHYALAYVRENGVEGIAMIEPISEYFLHNYRDDDKKKDVVLYNPKKNLSFTKQVIKAARDIAFIPLRGYTQQQLIDLYATSKLYIDFGNFPGAERIPKEAVLCGCCVVTGKNGASAYFEDVPIPPEYKIDSISENVSIIVNKIRDCLANYNAKKADFDRYRATVLALEGNFVASLNAVFRDEEGIQT